MKKSIFSRQSYVVMVGVELEVITRQLLWKLSEWDLNVILTDDIITVVLNLTRR